MIIRNSFDLRNVRITDENGIVIFSRLKDCLHAWECTSVIAPTALIMTIDQVLGYEKTLVPQERVRPLTYNGIKIKIA